MRASIHGLGAELDRSIAGAFRKYGHEIGEPADIAVVGFEPPGGDDLLQISLDRWEATIDGARKAFFAMQQAARVIVERRVSGCIIVVVPIHAVRTSRACGPAAVAGSFLATAAQVAAVELGLSGVRVNVLAAGPLAHEVPARTVDGVPLGRLADPSDIASACVMLASPEAAYLTGAVIAVDGGYAVTKASGGSPFVGRA
jgi:3-oxoacyl-[acyl-carrier protein] reductase